MNYFPLYTSNSLLYHNPFSYDNSFLLYPEYPLSEYPATTMFEVTTHSQPYPLAQDHAAWPHDRSRVVRSRAVRPRVVRPTFARDHAARPHDRSWVGRPEDTRAKGTRVKTELKEYTDEKVNFFNLAEDVDTPLEAYFLDFWNMCLGKNKKCDTCLQPYYNKKELEKVEIELTCVICMVNKKSMVFVDCGHFSVCFRCSKQCTKCPICSKTSKNILKVYLS